MLQQLRKLSESLPGQRGDAYVEVLRQESGKEKSVNVVRRDGGEEALTTDKELCQELALPEQTLPGVGDQLRGTGGAGCPKGDGGHAFHEGVLHYFRPLPYSTAPQEVILHTTFMEVKELVDQTRGSE